MNSVAHRDRHGALPRRGVPGVRLGLLAAHLLLAGCVNSGWFASSGPNVQQVKDASQGETSAIRLVNVDDAVARRLLAMQKRQLFSETLPATGRPAYLLGPGDIVEVSIWEAPPAALFGTASLDPAGAIATSRMTTFPEQMIAADGSINVPFAGAVPAAGRSPQEVEAEIARRLARKANQPQVLVRVTRNTTANVTVVGEVTQSIRMPLTAKGERLLDAIAAAGGVRQPVGKMTIQITRGAQVQTLALEKVIESPAENVPLAPGDVVTAIFQPSSFTVLGATSKNEEVTFEAQGISIAQGLARAGGLNDSRADARGLFIFRFEEPLALTEAERAAGPTTPEGKVPVVYRLDLKDPASFLVAQNFPMRDKDVIYVANAPSAELQKFLNILTSSIYSASSLVNLAQ